MDEKRATSSLGETKKFAENLALKILGGKKSGKAVVLGLEGDLGGGKTSFLQGFARGLSVKGRILSPSFVILRKFPVPGLKFDFFYHIDCYRIKRAKEVLELDFLKIIDNPKNIVAVEWFGKIRKFMPEDSIILSFKFVGKNKREITIKWPKRKD